MPPYSATMICDVADGGTADIDPGTLTEDWEVISWECDDGNSMNYIADLFDYYFNSTTSSSTLLVTDNIILYEIGMGFAILIFIAVMILALKK